MENKRPLQKEKDPNIRGKSPPNRMLFSQGSERLLPPIWALIWVNMECVTKYTIFSEIIHHIMISKETLKCNQLSYFLKIISEEHKYYRPTHEFTIIEIEQRYIHRTIDNASVIYYKNTSPNIHVFKMAAPTEDRFPQTILLISKRPQWVGF